MHFNPQDHYFKKAKKKGLVARSAFKLEEIDEKYRIFDKNVTSVLDIWCAPGSWLQYAEEKLAFWVGSRASKMHSSQGDDQKDPYVVIGFDIKDVKLDLPYVYTYNQDIQDTAKVRDIIGEHGVRKFDVIISDMAPNTIGFRDIDAMRSIELLRMTLPLYENFLKTWWKAVIKIFMWPWFDEFISDFKKVVGSNNIKVFKPAACRKESKETYIVKF
jgi:23S rRNA (uridine2552-2'-O)-methyltransferase